jgi:hypothetical protein
VPCKCRQLVENLVGVGELDGFDLGYGFLGRLG